jgi:hypothetical protein
VSDGLDWTQLALDIVQSDNLNTVINRILCFIDGVSLYNLVNKTKLVHNVFLSIFIFTNLYMFRPTM